MNDTTVTRPDNSLDAEADPTPENQLEPERVEPGFLVDALALLPEKTILDEARLAGVFGVTPRTVRRMVDRFELPPSVPLAGRSVWLAGRVLAYLDSKAREAEDEAGRNARKLQKLTS
ncbi:MAG: hypothetical protein HYU36_10735 [Planctomycetes bacterium]|nr:hypothetical protein [Planctomycetota bacterium]